MGDSRMRGVEGTDLFHLGIHLGKQHTDRSKRHWKSARSRVRSDLRLGRQTRHPARILDPSAHSDPLCHTGPTLFRTGHQGGRKDPKRSDCCCLSLIRLFRHSRPAVDDVCSYQLHQTDARLELETCSAQKKNLFHHFFRIRGVDPALTLIATHEPKIHSPPSNQETPTSLTSMRRPFHSCPLNMAFS